MRLQQLAMTDDVTRNASPHTHTARIARPRPGIGSRTTDCMHRMQCGRATVVVHARARVRTHDEQADLCYHCATGTIGRVVLPDRGSGCRRAGPGSSSTLQ